MIDALAALGHNQFEWATYYPVKDDRNMSRQFKFEQVSEREQQYSQPIQNLITAQGSIVIRTSWSIGFEMQHDVVLRGKRYIITNLTSVSLDISPQVRGLLKRNPNEQYILELVERE